MAAAALGNAFSNVLGMFMHGTIEKAGDAIGLRDPNLTLMQMQHEKVRWWRTCGNATGILIGCLLGMAPLLLMDCPKSGLVPGWAQRMYGLTEDGKPVEGGGADGEGFKKAGEGTLSQRSVAQGSAAEMKGGSPVDRSDSEKLKLEKEMSMERLASRPDDGFAARMVNFKPGDKPPVGGARLHGEERI